MEDYRHDEDDSRRLERSCEFERVNSIKRESQPSRESREAQEATRSRVLVSRERAKVDFNGELPRVGRNYESLHIEGSESSTSWS